MKRQFYAPYLRDQVDYGYLDRLPEEERVWLGVVTEDYRLKNEIQLHPDEQLRAAAARTKFVRAHECPLVFGVHRRPASIDEVCEQSEDEVGGGEARRAEARVLAGSVGIGPSRVEERRELHRGPDDRGARQEPSVGTCEIVLFGMVHPRELARTWTT